MRKEMRFEDNYSYWNRRWSKNDPDSEFKDFSIYPIKYANMLLSAKKDAVIIEIGCGLGRILTHYHKIGYNIMGMDNSKTAVEKIKECYKSTKVVIGDIKNTPFLNSSFDVLLAFGLYHNIENNIIAVIKDSFDCLKSGGKFCISMRPDNFEMRLNELFWNLKNINKRREKKHFHKWLVKENEFCVILKNLGLKIEKIFYAKNVSIFWRIPFLRTNIKSDRNIETKLRSSGYQLNRLGKILDFIVTRLFPKSFCNVMVFIGQKL